MDAAPPTAGGSPPDAPWASATEELERALGTALDAGLSTDEARRRLARHGPNRLRELRRRSAWRILLGQFESPIVLLLGAAMGVSLAFGERVEAAAIGAVVLINAAIGFVTEQRATRSMEALRALGQVRTTVRRDGTLRAIPAEEVVPGDVVVLDAGDVLTADLRLAEGSRLEVDESALTGESLPVAKQDAPVARDAPLGERRSMLFKGTAITRGSGAGLVVATGMGTELGRISSLVASVEEERTPLEKRLAQLGRRLIVLTVAIAAVVSVAFALGGREPYLAIEIGIALAVATFPEGLPIVATIALSRGMWRMARRNALVAELSAVDTLGATTLILSDKTGTLTENRMTVVALRAADGAGRPAAIEVTGAGLGLEGEFRVDGATLDPATEPRLAELVRLGVLCNDAGLTPGAGGTDADQDGNGPEATGDPTEVALLVLGAKAGLARAALVERRPELRELAFDPTTKRMATLHRDEQGVFAAVKGAPETVLEVCSHVRGGAGAEPLEGELRERWERTVHELASEGRRVLALATARVDDPQDFAFAGLTLVGLVGLVDPPREDVRAALDAARRAGIRVVMVTGDHGATGATVAAAVGLRPEGAAPDFVDGRRLPPFDELDAAGRRELLEATVLARVTPEQKLELIELHQRNGEVVAMLGDGVNDAPALQEADIGVAMGRRGTQVAREAADMVLEDDRFATIVEAVAQGRAIFANIRKFVVYLLSCNVSEILAVGLGALTPLPVPLLPLQILFLNLVTDVFPALALGVCEGSPALMRARPRDPREPLLLRRHWHQIGLLGAVIAASVLGALALAAGPLGLPDGEATSVAFVTLALAQLWHVFSMRNRNSGWTDNEVTRNPWVWGALALCVGLVALALWVPALARVLELEAPGPVGLGLALGASLVPLAVGQLELALRRPNA